MKKIIILVSITILAFFLRIYLVNQNPPSLNWDEVSHGYNAYSILKTGKDEWGIKFPLIFRAYGDYKLPLYIYLTAISEFFFGLNPLSVRLISILSGTGLVLLSFLIAKEITKENKYALFAAFLTALSPWSLFLSRIAVEANLGAVLFASGAYFAIKWLKSGDKKYLIFCSIFLGFSLHAYNSARVLIPIFFVLMLIFGLKFNKIKTLIFPGLILIIFSLPLIFQLINHSAEARYDLVSLIDQGVINQIIEKQTKSGLPKPLPKLIFNKVTFFSVFTIKNYLQNISPRYLFLRGGNQFQFSFPDHELLYLITAPFLLLGLVKIFCKSNRQEKFLGIWFLTAFIPSAITKDAPHVLRSILVLPSPMILSALGLQLTVNFLKEKSKFGGKLLISVLVLAVLVSFGRWWNDYFNIYPRAYSWSWQYGYKQTVFYIKDNYEKYDKIFFTKKYGEPHEFVLFYYPWLPSKYQDDPQKKWDHHASWYWVDGFDKFVFINDWEVIEGVKCERGSGKCLLITSPGNYPKGWTKIKTIDFLDGGPAFEILENRN